MQEVTNNSSRCNRCLGLYFVKLHGRSEGIRTFVHRNYSAAMTFTIFPRFLACKNQCRASQWITYPHPCMYLSSTRRMFYKGHLIRATLLTKKCFIKLLQSYVNKAHFILVHRDSSIYLSNMRTFRGHLRG